MSKIKRLMKCAWRFYPAPVCCVLLLTAISCSSGTGNESESGGIRKDSAILKQMEWVLGTWENISEGGALYETWSKTNDSAYAGKSFLIVKSDTVFSEEITLELHQGELYYIPVVDGQNSGRPVPFKLISGNGAELIFENKNHDFPQRIIYKHPHPDSLCASIEGNDKGKFRKEQFLMSRRKL